MEGKNMHEIERKFLAAWSVEDIMAQAAERGYPTSVQHMLPQAYMDDTGSWTCRVRVSRGADGVISRTYAMKRPVTEMTCDELETPVTEDFADQFIALCSRSVHKIRHTVTIGTHDWEVDVYLKGPIPGLVTIEVEMDSEDENVTLPEWVGEEVTGNPVYRNATLADRMDGGTEN